MKKSFYFLALSRFLILLLMIIFTFAICSCDILNMFLGDGDGDDNGDGDGDDTPITLVDDQFESNNTWQEAPAILLGREYSVNLDTNADIDFYSITTDHGSNTYDKVEFSLGSGSVDLLFHFEVYSTSGEKLLGNTAGTPGQNFTYTLACPGGTYLFRVTGWHAVMHTDYGSHGAYTFSVSNLDANDAQAPNQTLGAAAPVTFATPYSGTIVSIHEDDWYTVANEQSDRWDHFELQITDVTDSLAAGYFILDTDEVEIYGNHGANSSFDTGSNQFYSFASKSPTLYFRVCGWDNVMHSPNGSAGSYTFTIIDQNVNDAYEPDDILADAQVITVTTPNPLSISGTIVVTAANDNGGDYEWYKVNIANGTNIAWSADPADANTELHFNVYNAAETYLGQEDGGDGETITGNIDNTSSETSFFYIELGGYVGDTGNYTIEFTESIL